MNHLGGKIIDFATAQEAVPQTACETCGGQRDTGSVCRTCAVRLIDIALAGLDATPAGPPSGETELPAKLPVRRFYDHYEVCFSDDNVPVELGRGAMGITYKAIDIYLGCPVALKIVRTGALTDSGAAQRLLREARAAAQLRHPNIASIHHLGLSDEQCYYSMEYIEGETLEAFVRRVGPLPVETALEIVIQAARALRAAHEQHFVHRDIKPTNLMLMHRGGTDWKELVVKVIDFGLVKTLADQGASSLDPLCCAYFAGTPFFASPEQVRTGELDARSDIYSLGICLWYMLAGSLPGPSAGARSGEEHTLPALSPEILPGPAPEPVVALLRSMTAADPALRPQTAAALLEGASECAGEVRRFQQTSLVADNRPGWRAARLAVVAASAILLTLAGWWASGMNTRRSSAADNILAENEAKVLCDEGSRCVSNLTKADNQRAAELFAKALQRKDDFADAYAGLAVVHFQNVGRFNGPASELDLAAEMAQRAISLAPTHPKGYHALSNILTLKGKPWEALAQARKAIEVDGNYVPGIRQFGSLWTMVGRPHLGKPWLKLAARLTPTGTATLAAAADASVDLCMDDEAIGYYQRCLEVAPTSLSAHCGLMHIHLLQGDFAQASKDYSVIQSIAPGATLEINLKAQLELFQGNHEEAERIYRVLLAQNRTGNVTYYGGISYLSALGYLRFRAGDRQEAEALLAEATAMHLESEGPQGMFDLAAIRSIQGHTAEAILALRQAVNAGWLDYRTMKFDPRFDHIRHEPEFRQIVESLVLRIDTLRADAEKRCLVTPSVADYPVQPGTL